MNAVAPLRQQVWQVRAVLIDLDGTLLDTVDDLAAAANAMRADYGYGDGGGHAPLAVAVVQRYVGRGMAHLVQCCWSDLPAPLPADAVEVFRRHYRWTNGRSARVYPGVVEGLAALKNAGLRLACVTNKAQDFVPPLLEASGLAGWFDQVICGDTLARAKPDPLPLQHACAVFGIAPHEAVMIGDSLNDVQAARAAGCPVFCVPYGYAEGASMRAEDCDAIVPTLEAAARLLVPVPSSHLHLQPLSHKEPGVLPESLARLSR